MDPPIDFGPRFCAPAPGSPRDWWCLASRGGGCGPGHRYVTRLGIRAVGRHPLRDSGRAGGFAPAVCRLFGGRADLRSAQGERGPRPAAVAISGTYQGSTKRVRPAYEQVVQKVPLWTPGALDKRGSERLISVQSCSETAGHVRTARAGLCEMVPNNFKNPHGGDAMARRGPLCGGAARSRFCSIPNPHTDREGPNATLLLFTGSGSGTLKTAVRTSQLHARHCHGPSCGQARKKTRILCPSSEELDSKSAFTAPYGAACGERRGGFSLYQRLVAASRAVGQKWWAENGGGV